MQQYTVPQFIEVEDKIIGPITIRQFILMLVCGLIMFLEYKLSDMVLFIFMGIPTFIIFAIFAFLKVNGMPFHYFCLNVVETLKKPSVRIWSREYSHLTLKQENKVVAEVKPLPTKTPITNSRITDLSLVVDTGGIYRGEDGETDIFNDLNTTQQTK
jgi:hypothetical protein